MNENKISADEKWAMFKNYLHNDLGITKEDIRIWLQEAVEKVATNLVNKTFNDFNVDNQVERIINKVVFDQTVFGRRNSIEEQIKQKVAEQILEKIQFRLK